MEKRKRREELVKRLNDYEKQAGVSRHEPTAEEVERANELERELERERNWRSSGGFIRPA